MRQAQRQRSRLWALASASILAACGTSSIGPKPPPQAALAARIDTLYEMAASQVNKGDQALRPRSQALAIAEVAPAFSVQATSVTVMIGNATATWQGFVSQQLISTTDTLTAIVLYPDTTFSTMVVVQFGTTTALSITRFTNDSIVAAALFSSLNEAQATVGAACTRYPGLVNSTLPSAQSQCHLGTFTTELMVGFPSPVPSDTTTQFVTVPQQTLAGVNLDER